MPTANAKLHISERDRLERFALALGGAAGPVELQTAFSYMLDHLDIDAAIVAPAQAINAGIWSRVGFNLSDEHYAALTSAQAALTEDRRRLLGFHDEVSINQTVRFVVRNAPEPQ